MRADFFSFLAFSRQFLSKIFPPRLLHIFIQSIFFEWQREREIRSFFFNIICPHTFFKRVVEEEEEEEKKVHSATFALLTLFLFSTPFINIFLGFRVDRRVVLSPVFERTEFRASNTCARVYRIILPGQTWSYNRETRILRSTILLTSSSCCRRMKRI